MGLFLTDANCIKQREYVNLPAWDRYTGKGIVILHDDIEKDHSEACADIIQTILPEAKILEVRISYASNNAGVTSCQVTCDKTNDYLTPFEEFITKHNVSQINNSTDGGRDDNNSAIAKYMREMILKYNLFGTGSAGNFEGMTNKFQGAFIMVSGLYLKNGVISDYGSDGEAVDFSMFMGFQSGTSFSAPFLNGMGGKLRAKYGRGITQAEIYEYFKSHCKDLGNIGHDVNYGWGVPILGNPNEIKKETITAELSQTDVKLKPSGEIKHLRRILYKNENWFRFRDFEDVLGIADVDYDVVNKLPIVED